MWIMTLPQKLGPKNSSGKATAAFDWSLVVPARPFQPHAKPPGLSDAEITKGRRSLHLGIVNLRIFGL